MAEMSIPDPSTPGSIPPATPPAKVVAPAPRPRKRRLWWKILLGVVIALILLVLLLPTIASTGAVRGIVVGRVNSMLNGKVEIADWSIGWTSGMDVKGIRVFDETGAQIAQLDHLSTQLPLTKAIFGKLPLGKVIIDGLSFDAKEGPDGQLNFSRLMKQSPESESKSQPATKPQNTAPSKLPDISGDIQISNSHGTFEQQGKPAIAFPQIAGNVKIPDINQPITDQLGVDVKVGNSPTGKINLGGVLAVIQNNVLNLDAGKVQQTLEAHGIDLQTVASLLPPGLGIDKMQGTADTHADVNLTDGKTATLLLALSGKNIVTSGSALKGDTFSVSDLSVGIPVNADFPQGLSNWQSGRIKAGSNNSPVVVKLNRGASSLFVLTALADVPPQALLNLKSNQKPGNTGKIWVGTTMDLGQLAGQLPNTLKVSKDARITGGSEKQSLTIELATDKATVSGSTDITGVTGEKAGKPVALKPIHLAFAVSDLGGGGKLPDLRDLNLTLQSVFANADFHGDTLGALKGSLTGQLQSAQAELEQLFDFGGKKYAGDFNVAVNNQGDVTDPLAKLKTSITATLANLRSTPAPKTQGTLVADGNISSVATVEYDRAASTLNFDNALTAKSITVQSQTDDGKLTDMLRDYAISLNSAATIVSTPAPTTVSVSASTSTPTTAPASQIQKISVTRLDGNLGAATLSMTSPIMITNLAGSPTATGGIKLTGHLTDVTKLLATLQAKGPEAYPYHGDFAVTQNLSTDPAGIKLDGGIDIDKFQVMQGNTVGFSEDLVSIANSISMPADYNSVQIKNLTASMKSSGAMNLAIQNGWVKDLKQKRQLNLISSLQYDLAKLWPVIHPMLVTPGQEDTYKDLKIAGQYTRQFSVTGAYPGNVAFTEAIKQLIVDGGLSVDSFDHNGLSVQKLLVPIAMRDGKLMTIDANKPAGQNTAPPAIANGGPLDLSEITMDLTQETPRVSIPANKVLIKGATINPLFTDKWLNKFINNPLFVGTQNATGLVDVTVVSCDRLPAGKLAMQNVPQNDGSATFKFSLTNLNIGSKGVGEALGPILGAISGEKHQTADSFQANVKDATVAIAHGVATQHLVFQTGKYDLSFDGNVDLASEQLAPMTIGVPGQAIVSAFTHSQQTLGAVPEQMKLPMTGSLTSPHVDWQLASQSLVKDVAPNLIKNLIGGNKSNAANTNNAPGNATTQPAVQPENNPLGSLLNALQKKKK